jgi:hypothetical protein
MFPYLIWLDLTGGPILPNLGTVLRNLRAWAQLPLLLAISHLGLVVLVLLGHGTFFKSPGRPPEVAREPVDPGARAFVYFFALAPIATMGLFALITHRADSFVLTPLVVFSGLAVMIAAGDRIRIEHQYLIGFLWTAMMLLPPLIVVFGVLMLPWTLATDLQVGRPAADMGQFFAESFQRRTGRQLAIVSGERTTAALVAVMAPSRPSLYIAETPVYAPHVTRSDLDEHGAVVVWPATDTTGRPPPEIAQQFPNLVAEVPRAFERRFQGRMPLQRVGWAMIRPRGQAPDVPPAAPSAPLPLPLPPAEFPVQPPDRPQPQVSSPQQAQPQALPQVQPAPQRPPQRQLQRPAQPQLHAPQ